MSTKILICSDTHGHTREISDCILRTPAVDRIFHLGDYSLDVEAMEAYTGRKIIGVRGNNDYFDWQTPAEREIEIEAFRLLLVHGHEQDVYRGVQPLCQYAKEKGCDIVLYGHTHSYACDICDGVLYLNPGAVSWPRGDQKKSYAVLTLERGKEPAVERHLLED